VEIAMKKSIVFGLLLAAALIWAQGTKAQPPDTLWTHTYGGIAEDCGESMQQTSDGGYIMTGATYSFGAGEADVLLVKIDSQGGRTWQRTFGGSDNDWGYSVQQTSDGGFIISGETNSFGSGQSDVYLIKTDAIGNLVWDRTFGGSAYWETGYCVRQTADEGYIITGRTLYGSGTGPVLLIKVDANGNQTWTHTYSISMPGLYYADGQCVQQTSDGGYIILGGTDGSGSYIMAMYLIKTTSNGSLSWQRTYGDIDYSWGYNVQQTRDGGYILVGYSGFPSTHTYLVKTDANGNQIWQNTLVSIAFNNYGYSIKQTADGGYLIAGGEGPFSVGGWEVYLVKTDLSGNQVWRRTFGGSTDDYGYSLALTSDGGYAIAGKTLSYGAGDYDFYLIKTDAGGLPLNLTTSPLNPPITIPANGGSFQYILNVHNWTTSPQTFSIWNKVRDAANVYSQVFGPISRTLLGNTNPTRTLTQTIAGSISPGTLYFISYLGTYPNAVVDSSFFTFTKSTTSDGGPWVSESTCTGESFPGDEVGAGLALPSQSELVGISPNPFNPTTNIRFQIPDARHVSLKIYDTAGRLVATLVDGWRDAGTHEAMFDGSKLPSGVYLARLEAGDLRSVQKLVLLK
jgi:hypothetical protein